MSEKQKEQRSVDDLIEAIKNFPENKFLLLIHELEASAVLRPLFEKFIDAYVKSTTEEVRKEF